MNAGKSFATVENTSVASLFKEQFAIYDNRLSGYYITFKNIKDGVSNDVSYESIYDKLKSDETLRKLLPNSTENLMALIESEIVK